MENILKSLSEELRPKRFEDLVLEKTVKEKLQKMYDTRNVMNMLFYGKPGSGKTSSSRIFTDSDEFDCIIINGSIDTGVDIVRNKILNFTNACSLFCKPKICFIDECDYLSKNTQGSLRGVIENSLSNCRFILTCNELHKIQKPLQSRLLTICFDMTQFEIKSELDKYRTRVVEYLKSKIENVDVSHVNRIIDMNYPDFRIISQKLEFDFI
jgi:DNA polymerase III delta prime subunit